MIQNRFSTSILLILLFLSSLTPAFASMCFYELCKRPTNAEFYQQADIIAIVKTFSGAITETGLDGSDETKVVSKVLIPIKGTQQDAELEIYVKRAEINAEYLAILRWDEKVGGYRFLSREMDYSIVRAWSRADFIPVTEEASAERLESIKAMNKIVLSGIEEIKNTLGFQGEMVLHDGWLYLPNCNVLFPESCQRNFEQVQFMLKKLQEQKKPQ